MRRLYISLHMFESLFRTGSITEVLDGLPEDARVVRANYDLATDMLVLVVGSSQYGPHMDGDVIPVLSAIEFKSLRRCECGHIGD
jgi:hypothetical protein